jgi:diguanylate cyclase (GGDEF)-like protein
VTLGPPAEGGTRVLLAGLPDTDPAWLAARVPGVRAQSAATGEAALAALRGGGWALVVADDALPGLSARTVLERAAEAAGCPPVFLVLPRSGAGLSHGDAARLGISRVFFHPLGPDEVARQVAAALGLPEPGPEPRAHAAPSPAAEVAGAVAALWERFRGTILERVDVVEEAALAVLEGRLDPELRGRAEREAHKLAGSVGTFGFAEASVVARQVEGVLSGTAPLGSAEALQLTDAAVALRTELSRPAPSSPASPAGTASPGGSASSGGATSPPGAASPGTTSPEPASSALSSSDGTAASRASGDGSPADASQAVGGRAQGRDGGAPVQRLLIVDADAELGDRLAMEASGRGMAARVVGSVAAAREALRQGGVDAVLIDHDVPEGEDAALELMGELSEREPPVAVVALTARATLADRVDVARRGGRGFVQKPVTPGRVLDTVQEVLRGSRAHGSSVLVVDDDEHVLGAVRSLLSPTGVDVHTLDDPLRFWDALEAHAPDVLVLDVDMPHVSGFELCRVVRNDPRWKSLPVLFLTARTDAASIQRLFGSGADDYVAKPFVGPELVTRITNRLERVQLHRALADTDALTGVANRRKSEESITQLLRLAARQQQPFSVGIVDLDFFKLVNDRAGHAVGDEVLRRLAKLLLRSFRAEDVVARWGGEEFVVGMYGMEKDDGVTRLMRTLDALGEEPFTDRDGEVFHVAYSGGVAQYPQDGVELSALYRAADGALFQAKGAGRGRVLPAGWTPDAPQRAESVDVLVVDDDDAIARLLVHALETRGFRTRWIADGQTAADSLLGQRPRLKARVVLLDVDLPGLDGLGLLRALARDRVLDRTRVIMLTARSVETEVLQALDQGAYDHVAKPFSIPVLVQRVRRAMRG